jgi:hypothetical protein
MRFFLVDGTESVPIPSEELTPGWSTERLVMHLEYVGRTDVRLVWHLGEKAGVLKLGLGADGGSPAPGKAGEPTPPAGEVPGDAPRGGG